MKKLVSVLCSVMFIPALVFAADNPLSSHTTSLVLEASLSASSHSYQVARTYYLPDYQQELNNVSGGKYGGRTDVDPGTEHRNCKGALLSPKSGSGWNCGKFVHYHEICYQCEPKGCPNGEASEEVCMARKNGSSGWIWNATSNYTGDTRCGACSAKTCATSFKSSASQCGTCGANGWTLNTTGAKACYSGDKTLGTCVAKTSCPSGQMTQAACYAKTNGSNGWTWTASSGCVGDTKCGTCTAKSCDTSKYKETAAQCGSGTCGANGWSVNKSGANACYSGDKILGTCQKLSCNSPYSAITSCTPSNGYTFKADPNKRCNGDVLCRYCELNSCSGTTSVGECGSCGAKGWTWAANGCSRGSTAYGNCTAKACPQGYTSGLTSCAAKTGYTATYSKSEYCNGNAVCGKCVYNPSNCTGVASSAANCGSCGTNGWTWTANGCNSAGTAYGTCTAKACPSGQMTQTACHAKTNGSNGWTWTASTACNGNTKCGSCSAKACPQGYTSGLTSCAAKTGYTATYTKSTTFNGNAVCGKCEYTETACLSGQKTYANSYCATNQAWSGTGSYSGTEECGRCVTTCTVTACNNVEYQIGTRKITMPGTYSPQFCVGGNGGSGIGDNCGSDSCGKCDPQKTYDALFKYANGCSAIEEALNRCMTECTIMSAPMIIDKSICYTMCNLARYIKHQQGDGCGTYIYYCPPDMPNYDGEIHYNAEISDTFQVQGTFYTRFQTSGLPSCRYSKTWTK